MIDGLNIPGIPTASAEDWAVVLVFGMLIFGWIVALFKIVVTAVKTAATAESDAGAVGLFFSALVIGLSIVFGFVWVYLWFLSHFLP